MTNLIEPYNPAWKTAFETTKAGLLAALSGLHHCIDIQHVGSTAIPGMRAKAVLDIDIILHDASCLQQVFAALEKAGWQNRGEQGIEGRYAFRLLHNTQTTANQSPGLHLYVCLAGCLALQNHLVFRDALLADKMLAEQYSALKQQLAAEPGITREEYTRRKTVFILAVLAAKGIGCEALQQIGNANT